MVFNFYTEKQRLVQDLNSLKSLSVEEFTFRKKFEEIKTVSGELADLTIQAKSQIWRPRDIHDETSTISEISHLRPRMVMVSDADDVALWTALRTYCTTAEYNQCPGRRINFLLRDENSDKVLGFAQIASDVPSLLARDEFIGWTNEHKFERERLQHSAIGSVIVPTQPFGPNFLGGKLLAALATSQTVRNAWVKPPKGKAKPRKLVGMTTTSLYGSPSIYNSLKWWKAVGHSAGAVPITPSVEVYKTWCDWMREHRSMEYHDIMNDGRTSPKSALLELLFKTVGIKGSSFDHGFRRGVYFASFYENTKDFLCGRIGEEKLVMKPLFTRDTEAILEEWRPKAIGRYKKLKAENRLNPDRLFYSDMAEMDYETAKAKYLPQVGR